MAFILIGLAFLIWFILLGGIEYIEDALTPSSPVDWGKFIRSLVFGGSFYLVWKLSDSFLFTYCAFVGAGICYVICYFVKSEYDFTKSQKLNQRFVSLGDMSSFPLKKIVKSVGNYNFSGKTPQLRRFYTWSTAYYEITLLFTNEDVCLSVSGEKGFGIDHGIIYK